MEIERTEYEEMQAEIETLYQTIETKTNSIKTLQIERDQQQAEIERLRAALQDVIDLSYTAFPVPGMREIAIRGLGQQQPEPPQESLKVRILRVLAKEGMPAGQLQKATKCSNGADILKELLSLRNDGLIQRYRVQTWYITAAGRDYLASLEAKEDVVECQSCGSTISEEHQREYGLEDMCMDCAVKAANARADENKWMYPDR